MKTTREILAEHIKKLMSDHAVLRTSKAVESATAEAGLKVGRSSVDRVRQASTNVTLDNIEGFAQVFRLQPWQLLHPTKGGQTGPQVVTLADALQVIARALNELPDDKRDQAALRLQTFARAPDSAKALAHVAELLHVTDMAAPEPSAVKALITAKAMVNTRDFAGSPSFEKKNEPSA